VATGHRQDLALRLDQDGTVFKTDSGHVIYDCQLNEIHKPEELAAALLDIPGVMEHGLFINLADKIYLACQNEIKEIGKSQ